MHTKGKWAVQVDSVGGRTVRLGESGWTAGNSLTKADASLIAAAPELLEALRAFVSEYDTLPKEEARGLIGRIQKLFTNARKAVAQAENPE